MLHLIKHMSQIPGLPLSQDLLAFLCPPVLQQIEQKSQITGRTVKVHLQINWKLQYYSPDFLSVLLVQQVPKQHIMFFTKLLLQDF